MILWAFNTLFNTDCFFFLFVCFNIKNNVGQVHKYFLLHNYAEIWAIENFFIFGFSFTTKTIWVGHPSIHSTISYKNNENLKTRNYFLKMKLCRKWKANWSLGKNNPILGIINLLAKEDVATCVVKKKSMKMELPAN